MKPSHPPVETKNGPKEPPVPEVLKSQTDNESSGAEKTNASSTAKTVLRPRHGIYRPSHKATFIGLAVVVVILLVNAVIIYLVINGQTTPTADSAKSEVTISPAVLDTLGVSRNTVGDSGTELVVNPNASFNGKLTVGGDVSIAGQLKLNGALSGLTNLEAGNATFSQLNVNGDATITNLNLRKDLTVVGSTRLQGPVTVDQLLTVNSNINVAGNLAVGGTLTARGFQASSLTSDTTLTIGGHVITRGSAPGYSRGDALNAVDTISLSGNDAAGTVAVNIGAGENRSGILAYVTFVNQYGNTPHVIITAVGPGVSDIYVNRSSTGFSIGAGSISVGGHAFDYIVIQ